MNRDWIMNIKKNNNHICQQHGIRRQQTTHLPAPLSIQVRETIRTCVQDLRQETMARQTSFIYFGEIIFSIFGTILQRGHCEGQYHH